MAAARMSSKAMLRNQAADVVCPCMLWARTRSPSVTCGQISATIQLIGFLFRPECMDRTVKMKRQSDVRMGLSVQGSI